MPGRLVDAEMNVDEERPRFVIAEGDSLYLHDRSAQLTRVGKGEREGLLFLHGIHNGLSLNCLDATLNLI